MPRSARQPLPAELRVPLIQTIAADVVCSLVVVAAVLTGYLGHQVVPAVVVGIAGLTGIGLAWVRFFGRLATYRREHGLPV